MDDKDILTGSELNALYEKLSEPLPQEAIQHAETLEYKGYDTTGLGYQYIVNRFNEVLGLSHWRVLHTIETFNIKTAQGKIFYITVCDMTIQIGNWLKSRTVDINWFDILADRQCYGGHKSTDLADAKKGAYTNAIKKVSALYGVGRQAYEGTLDTDYELPEGETKAIIKGKSIQTPKQPAIISNKEAVTKFNEATKDIEPATILAIAEKLYPDKIKVYDDIYQLSIEELRNLYIKLKSGPKEE